LFPEFFIFPKPSNKYYKKLEQKFGFRPFRSICLGGGTFIYSSPNKLKQLLWYKQNGPYKFFCLGTGATDSLMFGRSKFEYQKNIDGWREILSNFEYIGVRGPLSKKMMRGVDNVEIVGDTSICLAPPNFKYKKKNDVVGLNIGYGAGWLNRDETIDKFKKIINFFMNEKYKIKILPVWQKDMDICLEIAKQINTRDIVIYNHINDYKMYLKEVESCDIFVGYKLHSVILSCLTRTPSVMLEYRPKCLDFMISMSLKQFNLRIDTFDLESFKQIVHEIQSSSESIQNHIDQMLSFYKNKLNRGAEKIKNVIA
jgi:polysaccharide pyruvyl transferase WcaK-like protein